MSAGKSGTPAAAAPALNSAWAVAMRDGHSPAAVMVDPVRRMQERRRQEELRAVGVNTNVASRPLSMELLSAPDLTQKLRELIGTVLARHTESGSSSGAIPTTLDLLLQALPRANMPIRGEGVSLLTSFLTALCAFSSQDASNFIDCGGYEVLLALANHPDCAEFVTSKLELRTLLTVSFADGDTAERLWPLLNAAAMSQIQSTSHGDARKLFLDDVCHLIAVAGLRPSAVTGVAETLPMLADSCFDILKDMCAAYEGDALLQHEILLAWISAFIACMKQTAPTQKAQALTIASQLQAHYHVLPAAWTTEHASLLIRLVHRTIAVSEHRPVFVFLMPFLASLLSRADELASKLCLDLAQPSTIGFMAGKAQGYENASEQFLTGLVEVVEVLLYCHLYRTFIPGYHGAPMAKLKLEHIEACCRLLSVRQQTRTKLDSTAASIQHLTRAIIIAAFQERITVDAASWDGLNTIPGTNSVAAMRAAVTSQLKEQPLPEEFNDLPWILGPNSGRAKALITTLEKRSLLLCEALLQWGCDPLEALKYTATVSTPFGLAMEQGNEEFLRLFIENIPVDALIPFALPNSVIVKVTALMLVAQKGLLSMMELLITRGANVNASPTAPNKVETVSSLPWAGSTPLHFAAGSVESTRLLLNHGANVKYACERGLVTPLYKACHLGQIEVAKIYLELGVSVCTPHSPLFAALAAPCNRLELATLLLVHGCHVNEHGVLPLQLWETKDVPRKRSPLYVALGTGDITMAKLLLDNGATLRNLDVCITAMRGCKEICSFLAGSRR